MKTFFTGSRTNDWVRNFLHIRYDVTSAVTFSRLAFFQFGADYYNQNTNFGSFVFGSAADGSWPASTSVTRDCSNTFSYGDGKPYRQELTGEAPWYISMSPQLDTSLIRLRGVLDGGMEFCPPHINSMVLVPPLSPLFWRQLCAGTHLSGTRSGLKKSMHGSHKKQAGLTVPNKDRSGASPESFRGGRHSTPSHGRPRDLVGGRKTERSRCTNVGLYHA